MSYTSINTVSGSVSDVETPGFKLVSTLKLATFSISLSSIFGINRQEGDDDDGYTERSCIITAIMPNNKYVFISYLGVYADNAIELKLNQYVKTEK